MVRIRVLHVNKFLYRRGGAEGYMLDLAALQSDRGHDVGFFGMQHPDNERPSEGAAPTHVEFDPPPETLRAKAELFGRMMWSTSARRGMDEALTRFRPDIVHAHNVYHQLSPSVLQAARSRAVPVVLTMHDYKLACPTYKFLDHGQLCTACVEGGVRQAVRRRCKDGSLVASTAAALEVSAHRTFDAFGGTRRFISPSRFLAEQMRRAGVFPDRLQVLSNFTDLDVLPSAHEAERRAVYAGRLSHEKGVDCLIEAFARVVAADVSAGTTPAVLDIAGDGPERAALEQRAATLVPGRVTFHGRLDASELRDLVRSARVSVVPSRWHENMPLAVLESFALGVPVVSTDLGGLPELVSEQTGWLVGADRPDDMAAAILQALDDPAASRAKGRRARRLAEDAHSPDVHLRALLDIYAEAGAAA